MTLTWSNEPMAEDLFEQRGSGPSPFAAPATLPEATPYPPAAPAFEELLGGGPWYEAWTGFEHEQPTTPAAAATATRPVSPADVLRVAVGEIGITEHPPDSNNNKYGQWYGMNYVPWCAIFVSYCFYTAGMPLAITTPKGFSYCPYGIEWFRRQGRLDMNPRVGDVVFYQFDQDAEADHVGIVESATPGGITAIEGNTSASGSQSNGGAVMRRDRTLSLVLGFGHPAYGMATTPTAPPALSPGTSVPLPVGPPGSPRVPAWPGRNLALVSPPMQGSDVQMWQARMVERGWRQSLGRPFAVDGIYGSQSEAVCKSFQKEQALAVDGVVGPVTWNCAWACPVRR
jgi:peptidoglycan hydrolase-like protein with peptidoglycan-binding domain